METNKTLIIGSGRCATLITEKLTADGFQPIVAAGDDGSCLTLSGGLKKNKSGELFTNTNLTSCKGRIGDYHITLSTNNQKQTRKVSHIIIAEEYHRRPNFSDFGLVQSENALSLEEFRKLTANPENNNASPQYKKIVFLTGLFKESNPVILEEIMNLVLDLQSNAHDQTYILTGNLKVAGNGLERLYRETKKVGAIYLKFTGKMPEINQAPKGEVNFTFFDEVLRENFKLKPDITIVEDTLLPSPRLKKLSEILGITRDLMGFLQADNIHRHPIFTNRKGVLVTGPSRNIQPLREQQIDAENAVLSVVQNYFQNGVQNEATAEINKDLCVRCLTCHRLCPHMAIQIRTDITVMAAACEACGLCAAECPAMAIKMKSGGPGVKNQIEKIKPESEPKPEKASIAVLACGRSGIGTKENAMNTGIKIQKGIKIISVPCAGSISIQHIFMLLKNKVDGILVVACHEDNCFSEVGNVHARIRVTHIKQKLQDMGMNASCLKITSIASNMSALFAGKVKRFQEEIKEMVSLR